jgi:hypothetical protein
VFRTGVLEGVGSARRRDGDQRVIPGAAMSLYIREMGGTLVTAAKDLGITGPGVFGAALLDIGGYGLGVHDRRTGLQEVKAPADRTDLVVDETWIESIEAITDVDAIVRPVLDILYQSFDAERCFEYDELGRWIPN